MRNDQATWSRQFYVVRCSRCQSRFDALTARWCECAVPKRNIRCPSCNASLYKARHFRTEAHKVFGVDDYLTMPLDLSALSQILDRLVPLGTHRSTVHAPHDCP